MRSTWIVLWFSLAAQGCGTPAENPTADGSEPPGSVKSAESSSQARERHACSLLTPEETQALEPTIVLRNVVVQEPEYSECHWEDKDGNVLFTLKVYWSGGRQQWEAWRAARGLAAEVFKKQEGVDLKDVLQEGPVPGIGDGAFFSSLLPSLVLKGDVLIEMTMAILEDPEAKFRPLATKLLGRIQ